MNETVSSLTFVALGLFLVWFAKRLGNGYSNLADRAEREDVIRYGGGLWGNKIWREDSPKEFEARIEGIRTSASFSRLFLKGVGAIFAIAGIARLVVTLFR